MKQSRVCMLQSVFWLVIVTLMFSAWGCSPRYVYEYPGHQTFTQANLAQVHVGMSASEVRALFGNPDEIYIGRFGSAVGEEWRGQVWIYFTEKDSRLRRVKRYRKNVFVFYPAQGSDDELRLNHWEMERYLGLPTGKTR